MLLASSSRLDSLSWLTKVELVVDAGQIRAGLPHRPTLLPEPVEDGLQREKPWWVNGVPVGLLVAEWQESGTTKCSPFCLLLAEPI